MEHVSSPGLAQEPVLQKCLFLALIPGPSSLEQTRVSAVSAAPCRPDMWPGLSLLLCSFQMWGGDGYTTLTVHASGELWTGRVASCPDLPRPDGIPGTVPGKPG